MLMITLLRIDIRLFIEDVCDYDMGKLLSVFVLLSIIVFNSTIFTFAKIDFVIFS